MFPDKPTKFRRRIEQAAAVPELEVPENITRGMTEFAADGAAIEQQRARVARAIEELRSP